MSIRSDNYGSTEGMWRRDGETLAKGNSQMRFQIKTQGRPELGQDKLVVSHKEVLDSLLTTLNDPQIPAETKIKITNLLSGKSSTAKVGAFEISALPEQKSKVESVFEKTVSPRTPENVKENIKKPVPAERPPPPLPELPPEGSIKLQTKAPPVPPRPAASPRSSPPKIPPPPPVPARRHADTLPPIEDAPARPVISPRDDNLGDKG